MAESTINKTAQISKEIYNGTSNDGGNFFIGGDSGGWRPVSAVALGTATRMFIPFKTGNSFYLKVLDWNNNAYHPVINGAVSIEVTWIR